MKWALVTTIERIMGAWVDVEIGTDIMGNIAYESQWQDITFPAGSIINILVYDGVSPYTPAEDTELMQVADDKQIGDIP